MTNFCSTVILLLFAVKNCVQSVAVRLLCERGNSTILFTAQELTGYKQVTSPMTESEALSHIQSENKTSDIAST